ncbi:uncharacterized protein LOC131009759 [Salvia miltiorrhiza]|uniref:uncharacterized protein LOC131009759 n=1 Tax=Salvia miltiorrhiza TaxID=226208 RepID=UPI0025AC0FA6|nr:uncharacterized protein LOC131009759 [Salvia miltiorrhiza]
MSSTESDYDGEEAHRGSRPSTSRRSEKYPTPNPPPRHAWLRPCMQGYAGRINHYIKDKTLKEVETCLTHYRRFEQFKIGPFGHLLKLKRQDSANAALHQLLARELYDEAFGPWEKWFHVGGHDIRFSALEYCLVTGLCFGPSPQRFDPNVDHRVGKESVWHRVFKGKKVEVKDLRKRFVSRSMGNIAEDYLKVANILVAGRSAVVRQNQQWIARGHTRLVAGVTRERTPIAFLDFYETLFREFRSLHPDEPDWDNIRDRHGYEEWVVPEKLIAMFHGTDSGHTWPWLEAKEIFAMCNLDKSHWCTVVISISAWEVRVYDSLIHVEGARKRRENAMKPITRLMPKLLHTVGYYTHNTVRYVAAPDRPMKVVIMPIREQFIQEDSVSCGVFACAYLDRLICGAPTREQLRTPAQIQKFRQIIAIRIWELCMDPPPIHFS